MKEKTKMKRVTRFLVIAQLLILNLWRTLIIGSNHSLLRLPLSPYQGAGS